MTLNRFLRTVGSVVLMVSFVSCGNQPAPAISPFEFHDGFMGMKWGSARQSLDSLVVEMPIQIVSDLNDTPGQRITVVRDSATDYYLEWSSEDRLNGLSTIHELNAGGDADSLIARLTRAYGAPVTAANQDAYIQRRWQTKDLIVEVITTDRFYSLKVQHP